MDKTLAAINFGSLRGFGKLGLEGISGTGGNSMAINVFTRFISSVIGILTVVGILWFIFILITGAISWMSAGGDKGKLESAKQRITTGIVGLTILVIATFVIDLIGNIIGIGNILNLPALFGLVQI